MKSYGNFTVGIDNIVYRDKQTKKNDGAVHDPWEYQHFFLCFCQFTRIITKGYVARWKLLNKIGMGDGKECKNVVCWKRWSQLI